jgi:hypothetical protein
LLALWSIATLLCLVQFAAALPWLALVGRDSFALLVRKPVNWIYAAGGVVTAGLALAVFWQVTRNPGVLEWWGRVFGSVLHAQLVVDGFIGIFALLLWLWPKGAAVALAAFREGIRQPLFWLLAGAAVFLLLVSLIVPYFTLRSEDEVKMVKQLGYDTVMLVAVAFGVIAASTSISEEIEGRTAVTLMSKPVSRRQFLLGKFVGILLAAVALMALAGWCLDWSLYAKPWLERLEQVPPVWLGQAIAQYMPAGVAASFTLGVLDWLVNAVAASPGLVVGSGQVMVLLAVAVALATRMPMMVNLVLCLVLFFLGHLAPVLVQVSQSRITEFAKENAGQTSATLDLIHFVARLTDTLLPAFEFVNMGPAIVRDTPPEAGPFAVYIVSVFIYYAIYTAIVLLGGLLLFEDRDLA